MFRVPFAPGAAIIISRKVRALMLSISWSTLRFRPILCGICSGVLLLLLSPLTAAQGNSAIAQEFQTKDTSVTSASIVGLVKDSSNTVELSTAANVDQLTGVVSNRPLIQLSDGTNGIQVVTSGLTLALVSNLNGDVVSGDKITVSPIEGVGMRADTGTTVVGSAQSNLKDVQLETRTIKNTAGKEVEVHIGLLPVQVGVAFYVPATEKKPIFVPPFLQSLANTVSGRDVSPARVLVAALILLLLFVSITVLLYSSVRSSIISIGRNPLSERAVRKSLLQVGLMVFGMLVFAVTIIYVVLVF
jgi:hypothetical protein